MGTAPVLIIIAAVILLIAFVPFLRSVVGILVRIAFFLFVVFVAIAGFAILRNNETVYSRPGLKHRVTRFLTVNWANTSDKGLGDAPCMADKRAAETAAAVKAQAPQGKGRRKKQTAQVSTPTPSATPTPAEAAEEEDSYDELVTHNYVCPEGDPIPRDKLFQMAQETVAELDGWKLINSDPRSGILNCVYTTRIFGFQDDIKILVTPKTDIEICSQSKVGEPDSTSLARFFHGDLGANMGHIKQFYFAFQPRADQFCKQLEEKQKARQPPQ